MMDEFLTAAGLKNTAVFFKFYDDFKKSRYLHSYAETPKITYALKRICMRVWNNPFTSAQEAQMTGILMTYRKSLKACFMEIFDEIGSKLIVT